ncbi:MAG: hypothetical protein RSD36_17715, partial [Terrisporobacter sp.]
MKKAKNLLLIYILLIVTFTTAMFGSYMLPNERVRWHVSDSIEQLNTEGLYPRLFFGTPIAQLDNFTDSWMLNLAVSARNDAPIKSALQNPYKVAKGYSDGKYTQIGNLEQRMTNPDNTTTGTYSRYWHGYLSVLRPMLMMFNYQEIRFINMCVLFLLFIIVISLIKKRLGIPTMLSFLFTMMCTMFFIVAMSLQFSSMYYIMFISMIVILLGYKNIEKKDLSIYTFFIIGAVASFLDLLTVPLLTLGMPLALYILLREKQNAVSNFIEIIKTSIIWAIGYGITWASKWVIATVVLKENIIKDALNQILVRTSDSKGEEILTSMDVITLNKDMILNNVTIIIFSIVLIVWIISMFFFRKDLEDIITALPILIIGLMPFVWYIALKNHSAVHYWFTYRSLGVTVFSTLAFMANCID